MEKLSKNKLYFIIIAAIALVALILVITTSVITYNNAKDAIANIGTVAFNQKSKDNIDKAQVEYDTFLTTLGASTTFKSIKESLDLETLENAKASYIEGGIRDVNTKYLYGTEKEEIIKELTTLRTTIDAYFPSKDYSRISNYSVFTNLESKFIDTTAAKPSQSSGGDSAEEVEIC